MRQAVELEFPEFCERFEGRLPFMYLDVLGFVTTGVGNLIDPLRAAIYLPWMRADGTPAGPAQISQAWRTVKAQQQWKDMGGMAFASLTSIRLTEQAIDDLVHQKLMGIEANLKLRFPSWDEFPADAQMGIISMAWAMGEGFHFPKFQAAAESMDWSTASEECKISETGNPGVKPRNIANKALFLSAASGGDPEELHLPPK